MKEGLKGKAGARICAKPDRVGMGNLRRGASPIFNLVFVCFFFLPPPDRNPPSPFPQIRFRPMK